MSWEVCGAVGKRDERYAINDTYFLLYLYASKQVIILKYHVATSDAAVEGIRRIVSGADNGFLCEILQDALDWRPGNRATEDGGRC